MSSQALYRKWRSQTFAQVMGQEHVTRTLLNELETGRIAHAYLFCGPRGTGKTSTARILAKALNCRESGKGEPCNECSMCTAVTMGRALDLIEIDAASNRGIDEIRDLREKVNFAPNEARYKVYIVDEVHMLTDAAFNALLKTLEEPPAHSVFILATTEPHKVPATIFSRCQRFDFRRIPLVDSTNRLAHISSAEGIEIEAAALELIAKSATGSLRDAENILDQVFAYYGNPITTSQVMNLLGLTGDARVEQIAQALLQKETGAALTTINSIANDGLDLRQFNKELVDYLRNLLYLKLNLENLVELPEERVGRMQDLAGSVSLARIHKLVKVFSQIDFRHEGNASLLLELAVVESVVLESDLPPVEAGKGQSIETGQLRASGTGLGEKSDVQQKPALQTQPHRGQDIAREISREKVEDIRPSGTVAEKETVSTIERAPGDIKTVWARVIEKLQTQPAQRNVVALIRDSCEPELASDEVLKLNFYYKFHRDKASEPRVRQAIEGVLAEVTGQRYRVECDLAVQDKDAKIKKSEEDPLVKAALDLGGKIVDVQ